MESEIFPQPQWGQVKAHSQSQPNPRQGRAHKLISFIVFLHVLKASASNGSKNKKVLFWQRVVVGILTLTLREVKCEVILHSVYGGKYWKLKCYESFLAFWCPENASFNGPMEKKSLGTAALQTPRFSGLHRPPPFYKSPVAPLHGKDRI